MPFPDQPTSTGTTTTLQPDHAPSKPLEPHEKKDLFRRSTSLTLMAVLLIALVGCSAIVLLRRHRARLVTGKAPRKRRPPPDPWFESSRRLGPRGGAPFDGSDDDTVDLDPDDIRPIDVETDEDDDEPRPEK